MLNYFIKGLGVNHTVHLVCWFAPTNINDGANNSEMYTTTNDGADGESDGKLGEGFPYL